jgi:hypothetical protein
MMKAGAASRALQIDFMRNTVFNSSTRLAAVLDQPLLIELEANKCSQENLFGRSPIQSLER